MTRWATAERLMPAVLRPLGRRALVRARFLGLRPNDALLVSYPKSGSTWLRFLLAQILEGHEPDYGSIRGSIAPVGLHRRAPALLPGGGRVLRTHEPLRPYRGRPGQPLLYLVRDPRDVCVSYFNHRRRQGDDVSFPTFALRFLEGRVDGVGPWPEHVRSARDFSNQTRGRWLALRYEDLQADPVRRLLEVAAFLGVEAEESAAAGAVEANSRDRMRQKEDPDFLRRVGMEGDRAAPERRSFAELAPDDLRVRFDLACGLELQEWGYPAMSELAPFGKRDA